MLVLIIREYFLTFYFDMFGCYIKLLFHYKRKYIHIKQTIYHNNSRGKAQTFLEVQRSGDVSNFSVRNIVKSTDAYNCISNYVVAEIEIIFQSFIVILIKCQLVEVILFQNICVPTHKVFLYYVLVYYYSVITIH